MIGVRERPPLREHYEIVTPNGRLYRWGADDPRAENIPSGVHYTSTMPGGHATFDATLPRRPGIDYGDIKRLSTIQAVSASGTINSEARLERAPEVSGDQMSISPSATGWQAHLADDKSARLLVIDRGLDRWKGMSAARLAQVGDTYSPQTDGQVTQDQVLPALRLDVSGQIAGADGGFSEIFYDAGAGQRVKQVQHQATELRNIAGANWDFHLYGSDDDIYTGFTDVTGDLGDTVVAFRRDTLTAPQRWVVFQLKHGVTYTDDELERWRLLQNVAVVGDHPIPLITDPVTGRDGVLFSDFAKYAVPLFAPLIVVRDENIDASAYIIDHLLWSEMTTVGEMLTHANRFELLDWAVWDRRELHIHRRGARGRRWKARVGPSGLTGTGPQLDRLWESIVVQYTDVDGSTRTVGPPGSGADTETADLHDPDPENPANQLNMPRRDLLVMGTGTPRSATQLGVEFLRETKLLDKSGQATFVGYIMDDRGVLRPVAEVRAGDTVEFLDARDTSARRIVKVDHARSGFKAVADLDAPPDGLAALLERLGAALVRFGLG